MGPPTRLSARGAIVAMSTEPFHTVKDQFSTFVDRVCAQHERITVTRNGRAVAVLLSIDDLESMEETLAVLSDQDATQSLVASQAALDVEDEVVGVDGVRALRPQH